MTTMRAAPLALALCCLALATTAGCGRIADTDQIQVASLDGKAITRADLFRIIRNMRDDERPVIRNRGDLLRVLSQHIDEQVTLPLGRQLAREGKISVPREEALERYFATLGDQAEQQRALWNMEIPASGETTPLMQVYELTPEHLRAQKDFIDQEVDILIDKILGERAVQYLAVEALQKQEIALSEERLAQEYSLNPEAFQRLEQMVFRAIRIPAEEPDAVAVLTQVRRRVDAGEDFELIVDEFLANRPGYVIESEIENNPEAERFHGFWQEASGAEKDAIIGPVYLPAYQQLAQDAQGRVVPRVVPESYMVLRVLEMRPGGALTLEEAKPVLAMPVLVREMMQRLRDERGVRIFEDKLPDPQRFMDQSRDPLLDL